MPEVLTILGQYETSDAESRALLHKGATIQQKTDVYAVLRKRFESDVSLFSTTLNQVLFLQFPEPNGRCLRISD